MHDIIITYAVGDALAFLKPMTAVGRNFLSDQVKGLRIHTSAMAKPIEALALIEKATIAGLAIVWRKS